LLSAKRGTQAPESLRRNHPANLEENAMDDQRTVSDSDIKIRARQLWIEQGKPPDSAERNWLEAEHELNAAAKSRSLLEKSKQRGGSVQP